MYIKEVREVIRDYYGDDIIFLGTDGGSDCYDKSIVGVTDTCDNYKLIYDYDAIIEELMNDNNWNIEEAIEWYDFNIVRALPYGGELTTIIMINPTQIYDDAKFIINKDNQSKELKK